LGKNAWIDNMDPKRPKVTVYIPCHNYGRFLSAAIDSVISQIFQDWELIIINDGSSDNTEKIASDYVKNFQKRITYYFNSQPKGLRACANKVIESARGEYIMRLDADDFLDESALLVMTTYLDYHPDVALVYPNYSYVDEKGKILYVENRKKIGTEVKVLNLPAHGACTMVRKRVLKSIGGYDEKYDAQDGYELWLKVIDQHQVGNVSTPLFYYRQHHQSMTQDENRVLSARQKIKRDLVAKRGGSIKPRIVAIVPAKNTYQQVPNIAFKKFRGKPLIDFTLDSAIESNLFEKIFVTTDDKKVVDYCSKKESVIAALRDPELSHPNATPSQILFDAVNRLEQDFSIYPDILVLLSVNSPLHRPDFIRTAIDTLLLYSTDSVISVYEDNNLHFIHGDRKSVV
jgi:glycosyltransferase involved in cell wall biosynthesis